MKLSVVIPAHDEEANIGRCLDELTETLRAEAIAYEIIVVDDNSTDDTAGVVRARSAADPAISLVTRQPPGGFGRAIRAGIERVSGDVVVVYMADLSDDPRDAVAYHRLIEQGYDCVFGSRFVAGSHVDHYPPGKRIANRLVNRAIQLLFWTRFNDLTNAFKAYRVGVVRECGPYRASHFNITLEMSLSALIRRYRIAQIPIRWYGRTWGSSKLRLRDMGRKYLYVVIKLLAERVLVVDDVLAERMASEPPPAHGTESAGERSEGGAGTRVPGDAAPAAFGRALAPATRFAMRATKLGLHLYTLGSLLVAAALVGARAAYYGVPAPPEWLQRECAHLMLDPLRHAGASLSTLPWQAAAAAALAIGLFVSRRPFFARGEGGRLQARPWLLALLATLVVRDHAAFDADPFVAVVWAPTLALYALGALELRGRAPHRWRRLGLFGAAGAAIAAAFVLAPSAAVRVAIVAWAAILVVAHRLTRHIQLRDACLLALCAAPLPAFVLPAVLPVALPWLRESDPVVVDDHGYAYAFCEPPGGHSLFMTVPVGQTKNLDASRSGYLAEIDLRTGTRRDHRLLSHDFYGGLRMIACLNDGTIQITMKQAVIDGITSESNVLELHASAPERARRSIFDAEHRRLRGADVLGHALAYDSARDAVFYVSEWTNSVFRLDRARGTLDTTLGEQLPKKAQPDGQVGPQTGQYGPQTGPSAVSHLRRTLYLAEWADGSSIYELDLDALAVRRRFDTRDTGSFGLSVDDERDRLYASGLWGVNVIDLRNGRSIARVRTGVGARAAVIDARRGLVYVPTTFGGHMWVLDREDHRLVGRVTTGIGGRPAYLTRDGRWLFGSDQTKVLRWDAELLARRLRGSS